MYISFRKSSSQSSVAGFAFGGHNKSQMNSSGVSNNNNNSDVNGGGGGGRISRYLTGMYKSVTGHGILNLAI
jgi:hypothetical protein